MRDVDFWDRRSNQLKRAFLAGRTGQGGGVRPLVKARLGEVEVEYEQLQRDGGDDPQRGESTTG